MEGARQLLQAYLKSISSHWNARWYVINHPDETDQDSFAFACGLNVANLEKLFEICQFIGQGKAKRFKRVAFEEFVETIPQVEYGWVRPHGKGTLHCIRVGSFTQQNGYVFKPEEQFGGNMTFAPKLPPRSCEHRSAFVSKVKEILSTTSTTTRRIAGHAPAAKGSILPADGHGGGATTTTKTDGQQPVIGRVGDATRTTCSSTTSEQEATTNDPSFPCLLYSTPQEQLVPPAARPLQDLENQEDLNQQEAAPPLPRTRRRLAFAPKSMVLDTPTRLMIGAKPILEVLNEENYPVLHKLGVQLKDDHGVKALLRDIDKLANQVTSVNIREFSSTNERSRMWLTIPRSTTLYYFRQNRKPWLDTLLDAILASPENQERAQAQQDARMAGDVDYKEKRTLARLLDEQVGTHPRDSARWLMIELGRMFPEEFDAAGERLGKPIRSKVMSPEASFAMLNEANIGVRAARVLRKHLRASGSISFLPSEKRVQRLGLGAVLPRIEEFSPSNAPESKIQYAYKPLDEVVKHHVMQSVRLSNTINAVDIVVGADHGQGAFRIAVKMIMRSSRIEEKKVIDAFLGEIECKKDTTEIVQQSFALHINHALDRMMGFQRDGKEIIATGSVAADGYILVKYSNDDNTPGWDMAQSVSFRSTVDEEEGAARGQHASLVLADEEGKKLTRVMPFRVFVTGDLAFYSMCLGKENASGSWCWICTVPKSLWGNRPTHSSSRNTPQHDTNWTLEDLQAVADKVAMTGGTRQQGVIRRPMLTRVGVDRFVPPLLHQMLGIGNNLLKHMLQFIDHLPYEHLPDDIVKNREDRVSARATVEEIDEELCIWNEIYGNRLTELKQVRKDMIVEIDTTRKSLETRESMTQEERKSLISSLDQQKRRVSEEIAKLQREKKRIKTDLLAATQELRNIIRETPEKSIKNVIRPLRERIERRCLKPFRIDRAVYHGGDLTGNAVRQLMINAREVGKRIIDCLLEANDDLRINPRGGNKQALSNEEFELIVVQRIHRYVDCLTLFDAFFSQCRTTKEGFEELQQQHNQQASAAGQRESAAAPVLVVVDKAREFVYQAMEIWRSLGLNVTPKAHSCEVHNCNFMSVYMTGLGDFDEEFVERQHQSGLKNRIRTRASMRDPSKMYTHFSYYEQAENNEDVLRIKVEVDQKSKRRFKEVENRKETKEDAHKRQRIQYREAVREKYSAMVDWTNGAADHAADHERQHQQVADMGALPSVEDHEVALELERREKEDSDDLRISSKTTS